MTSIIDETESHQRLLARSLSQIRALRQRIDDLKSERRRPIAIIGMGCRLPGGIDSPDALAYALDQGVDAIGEIPESRWDIESLYDPDPEAPGKMNVRRGGFLEDVDKFDAALFSVSPREAVRMDPQQRIFLEVAYEAIERSGIAPDQLQDSPTGVFVGVTGFDYAARQLQTLGLDELDPYFLSGSVSAFIAGRLSFALGLTGPAMTVDTACSSSLVAVHLAVASLRRGECSMAVAGGVNVILSPEWNVVLSRARMLAPEGRCKTFDQGADGYVRGEGCGAIVLKPLDAAERDGDRIHAVIRGSAVNQDGASSGITVPNGLAQRSVLRAALEDADMCALDVDYIEAHGTGTALGDPIEVRSISEVYGKDRAHSRPLRLASLKTNFGHMEPAAGIMGLIKTAIQVSKGCIYRHLHFEHPNPELATELVELPAEIPQQTLDWSAVERCAGVSSFGATGTNVHLLVSNHSAPPRVSSNQQEDREHMLLLTALNETSLKKLSEAYLAFSSSQPQDAWSSVCSAAATGRARFAHRRVIIASDAIGAAKQLREVLDGGTSKGVIDGRAPASPSQIAFVYPGQGSQTLGMGQQLYADEPVFRAAFDRCAEVLSTELPIDIRAIICGDDGPALLDQTRYAQPCVFAVGWSLTALWSDWGIRPSAVLGHSVGEFVAAAVAGVFALEDALRIVSARGRMMQELAGEGKMISLAIEEGEARALIEGLEDRVSIAAVNGRESVVLSGFVAEVQMVLSKAHARGIKAKKLDVSHGFHSPQMDPMLDAFERVVASVQARAPSIPTMSNLSATWVQQEMAEARYWRRHVREAVLFRSGLANLREAGISTFVELGARPTLSGLIRRELGDDVVLLPSLRPSRSERGQMLTSAANLTTLGHELNWRAIEGPPSARPELPTYPFNRRRYWYSTAEDVEVGMERTSTVQTQTFVHPLMQREIRCATASLVVENTLDTTVDAHLSDFVIDEVNVVNIGIYIEMLRAVVEYQSSSAAIRLDEIVIQRACVLGESPVQLQLVLNDRNDGLGSLFSFYSMPVTASAWTLHCEGRVVPGGEASSRGNAVAPVTTGSRGSGEAFYQQMERRAIVLGRSGRWLETISVSDDTATCTVRDPDSGERSGGFSVHPGVVDSAFQAAYALLPSSAPTQTAYMLVGTGPMLVQPGWPTLATVQRRSWNAETGTLVVDVSFNAADGTPVLEVRNAMLKRASRAQLTDDAARSQESTVENRRHRARSELERAGSAEARLQLVECCVRDQMAAVLGLDAGEVETDVSVLRLGLDSLMAVDLKRRLEEQLAVGVSLVSLLEGPSAQELANALLPALSEPLHSEIVAPVLAVPDPEHAHEPFPLTDLQQAYLVGRSGDFELGNVSTYFYLEVELRGLELDRLEASFNTVVARHGMLRAVFTVDGLQRVTSDASHYALVRQDLRGTCAAVRDARLLATRTAVSGRVFDTTKWPLFEIQVSILENGLARLHIGFDALIVDAWSTSRIFDEWARCYRGEALEPLEIGFRDYILALQRINDSSEHQRAVTYWTSRLDTLPDAPTLPLARAPESLGTPQFQHRTGRLSQEEWSRFCTIATKVRVTPSSALCRAYAEVLAAWSRSRHFTLNVLYFNRLPLHPQVKDTVANFSSTTLLEVDCRGGGSFSGRVQQLQRQLSQDLDHGSMTGVEVSRRLNGRRGGGPSATMPVVFASTISLRGGEEREQPFGLTHNLMGMATDGQEVCSSIRTPQVWLDHQVIEEAGGLTYNWDSVDELFPPEMVEMMFEAYATLLRRLCTDEAAWSETVGRALVSDSDLSARHKSNATDAVQDAALLHAGFVRRAMRSPRAEAIITPTRTLTYAELDGRSEHLCRRLIELGVDSGARVAICMHKGWEQVVAVIAIHKAGGAYVPIDAALPPERVHYILEHAEARVVTTQVELRSEYSWPDNVAVEVVDGDETVPDVCTARVRPRQEPSELAYIIYTSGSTGTPKGVAVSHKAAMNTIVDINRRFKVCATDRVLALSSLSFDLSVYDVFGLLSVGGGIVLPDFCERAEPAAWLRLLREHKVTLWNSVPALVDAFTEHVSSQRADFGGHLRTVLMSGDWIPVSLPARIHAIDPSVETVSLGGATEAAIWSIVYPIREVEPDWPSIPYGRPLANQRFHIFDDDLASRPTWVPGHIYIAGEGLAMGYWNDQPRTSRSFFEHPRTGERLYNTGDLGRYLPDGNIEFLGREDTQAKVQGYRIELGEVDAALSRVPQLDGGVTVVRGEGASAKTLVSYVLVRSGVKLDEGQLREQLAQILPAYMMPALFVKVASWPLTANGKIDRVALQSQTTSSMSNSTVHGERVPPRNPKEQQLLAIWCTLLGHDEIGCTDDFFSVGGQSFVAMRLMARIQSEFGLQLSLSTLFECATIRAQAEYLTSASRTDTRSPCVLIRRGAVRKSVLALVHPVGGHVLCYRSLAQRLDDVEILGMQAPGLRPDENPLESIPSMAEVYIAALKSRADRSPLHLGGWSLGGIVAWEMAHQLESKGVCVSSVHMFDSRLVARTTSRKATNEEMMRGFASDLYRLAGRPICEPASMPADLGLLYDKARRESVLGEEVVMPVFRALWSVYRAGMLALDAYEPPALTCPVCLYTGKDEPRVPLRHCFRDLALGVYDEHTVAGDHYSLLTSPKLEGLAGILHQYLMV